MSNTPPPPPPPPSASAGGDPENPRDARARAKADKAYQKASRPWYQKKRFLIPGVLLLLLVVGPALGGGDDTDPGEEATGTASPETTDATPSPTDGVSAVASEPSAAPSTATSESAPAASATEEPAPATSSTSEPTTTAIGSPANDGKFQFTVDGFECGATSVGDDIFGEEAQGQFCLLELTVENTGNEAQFMFADNQYLHDDADREFSADSAASFAANIDDTVMFAEEINPGNSITGTVVFDVPEGATIVDVELHDSAFSGGVVVQLN